MSTSTPVSTPRGFFSMSSAALSHLFEAADAAPADKVHEVVEKVLAGGKRERSADSTSETEVVKTPSPKHPREAKRVTFVETVRYKECVLASDVPLDESEFDRAPLAPISTLIPLERGKALTTEAKDEDSESAEEPLTFDDFMMNSYAESAKKLRTREEKFEPLKEEPLTSYRSETSFVGLYQNIEENKRRKKEGIDRFHIVYKSHLLFALKRQLEIWQRERSPTLFSEENNAKLLRLMDAHLTLYAERFKDKRGIEEKDYVDFVNDFIGKIDDKEFGSIVLDRKTKMEIPDSSEKGEKEGDKYTLKLIFGTLLLQHKTMRVPFEEYLNTRIRFATKI